MKADRLTRKTHLKRHMKPFGDVTVYDLTGPVDYSDHVTALCAIDNGTDGTMEKIAAAPYAFEKHVHVLSWLAAITAHSPTAGKLWREAEGDGWALGFADLKSGGFYLDIDKKHILLDHFTMSPSALGRSAYFRNALLLTLVRALRDIWHEARFGAFENHYNPEDVLMLERIRAADCDTVTVLAAWELRGAGFADVWRHMIGSEEGDMALMFTRFLERDPTALFDGSALAYAFRQWYADENRVDGIDHETLETLDDLFLGSGGDMQFGQAELRMTVVESLSELPDGICYLKGLGETIISDPFFSGLNDPINQTHLFHLMYDMEVVMVNNVPFRDARLARMIFPEGELTRTRR